MRTTVERGRPGGVDILAKLWQAVVKRADGMCAGVEIVGQAVRFASVALWLVSKYCKRVAGAGAAMTWRMPQRLPLSPTTVAFQRIASGVSTRSLSSRRPCHDALLVMLLHREHISSFANSKGPLSSHRPRCARRYQAYPRCLCARQQE